MSRLRLKVRETCQACQTKRITPGSGLTVCPDCQIAAGHGEQLALDLPVKETG